MYTVTLSGTQGVNRTTVCAGFLILFPGRRHPICKFFFLRRRGGGGGGGGTTPAGLFIKRHLSRYFMRP